MDIDKISSLLKRCFKQNGVFYLHKDIIVNEELEQLYLKVRTKEGHIYDDVIVSKLPDVQADDINYKQWQVRKYSSQKLMRYLLKYNRVLSILDLGCGNGWFSNKLAQISGSFVIGMDINRCELEQAVRIFKKDNLNFVYADIFDEKISRITFDIIILNASIQYFPDIDKLINDLMAKLDPGGEIHILDTPLYTISNIEEKKNKSKLYYESIGFPMMINYYNHHLLSAFKKYKPDILYDPGGAVNKIKRFINPECHSPFPWLRIENK